MSLTSAARAERQATATIYARLLQRGYTREQLDEVWHERRSALRSIHLTYYQDEFGSDPVVGIAYTGDFRSEEESGIRDLASLLEKGERQDYFCAAVTVQGLRCYAVLTNSYLGNAFTTSLSEAYRRHREPYVDKRDCWRLTVKQMREALKGLVRPLPSGREATERAYLRHVKGQVFSDTESVGEFHNGRALVLATTDALLVEVLEMLFEDTVQANALRLGASSNPFSSGAMFYDERDVSVEELARQAEEQRLYDERLEAASSTIEKLRSAGSLYAIKPAYLESAAGRNDEEPGVYYFINFYYPYDSSIEPKSVFGWFTVGELELIAAKDADFLRDYQEKRRG